MFKIKNIKLKRINDPIDSKNDPITFPNNYGNVMLQIIIINFFN
jgi:hypothetical protein